MSNRKNSSPHLHSLPGGLSLSWPGKHEVTTAPKESVLQPVVRERYGSVSAETGRLYWGNNLSVLDALLVEESGTFDLIYMDPPFATGDDFSVKLSIGENGKRPKSSASWTEIQAYHDKWEGASFWSMMYARLLRVHQLLSETGTLFLHCDHRTDWVLRGMLEEIFGVGQVINQIVWHYTGGGRSKRRLSRKYDTIFWVAKGSSWTYNMDEIRVPYKPSSGYAKGGITSAAGKKYMPHPDGTPVDDVWDIPIVNPMSRERWDYPTQKPVRLLERIIRLASNPGDKVADFFSGSGTTIAVAEQLGRQWVGCDQGHWSIHTTRKRLLAKEQPTSFSLYESPNLVGQPSSSLQVSVEVEHDNHLLKLSLTDMDWVGADSFPSDVEELVTTPMDWVDAWSVDTAYSGNCFEADWYVARTRDNRVLPSQTDWLSYRGEGRISVRVYDILGGMTEIFLPLPAGS